jgi:hypothetical protein
MDQLNQACLYLLQLSEKANTRKWQFGFMRVSYKACFLSSTAHKNPTKSTETFFPISPDALPLTGQGSLTIVENFSVNHGRQIG